MDGGVISELCVAAGLVRFLVDGRSIVCVCVQVRDVLGGWSGDVHEGRSGMGLFVGYVLLFPILQ